MIKILVVYFVDRELDGIPEADWKEAKNTDFSIDFTKRVWNCFDEGALATALSLKAQSREILLEAVTISSEKAYTEQFAGTLYALGFHKIYAVCKGSRNPEQLAEWIDQTVSLNEYHAVFTGQMISPEDRYDLPVYLSEAAGIPCFTSVVDVEWNKDGSKAWGIVYCQNEMENKTYAVKQAAIFSFANARHAYLTMPSLRERIRAKEFRVLWNGTESETECEERVRLEKYRREKSERNCVMNTELHEEQIKMFRTLYLCREV